MYFPAAACAKSLTFNTAAFLLLCSGFQKECRGTDPRARRGVIPIEPVPDEEKNDSCTPLAATPMELGKQSRPCVG